MKKIILIGIITITFTGLKAQTAIQNYELMSNDSIVKRTEMLLVKSCLSIIGEDTASYSLSEVNKRHSLAMNALSDIQTYRQRFLRAICAQGTLSETSSDNDIEFTINAVFNDLAGIKFND